MKVFFSNSPLSESEFLWLLLLASLSLLPSLSLSLSPPLSHSFPLYPTLIYFDGLSRMGKLEGERTADYEEGEFCRQRNGKRFFTLPLFSLTKLSTDGGGGEGGGLTHILECLSQMKQVLVPPSLTPSLSRKNVKKQFSTRQRARKTWKNFGLINKHTNRKKVLKLKIRTNTNLPFFWFVKILFDFDLLCLVNLLWL